MGHFSPEKIRILRALELLVIDEISMVRADWLDAIDRVLRRVRARGKPFGGVQLLLIGDLFQLTPVVKPDDWELLRRHYASPYFFSSKALLKAGFVVLELTNVFRQHDPAFVDLLNRIREHRLDSTAIRLLNSRYQPGFRPDTTSGYITLTTHNQQAQRINTACMHRLDAPGYLFEAEVVGHFPPSSYPNDPHLLLKLGAQVMLVKNDASKEKRYYNGKIGVVTAIEDGWVEVACPGDDAPILTGPVEWQHHTHTLDERTDNIVDTLLGTFTQLPLKPAWAITIHKSQGLSFDRVVIDAGAAFAHGQVYVALSRCRTLEGLVLTSAIRRPCLKGDPAIEGFLREVVQYGPNLDLLSFLKRGSEVQVASEMS